MAEAAGMFVVQQTMGSVLCCKCGIPMQPNAANMCVTCLRTEVDITEALVKRLVLLHCPECNGYMNAPRHWIKTQLESKELLAFCMKRLEGLTEKLNIRMVHAEFVWTEPHSRRIKLRLRLQKEVLNCVVLEQSCVVEFVVHEHLCEYCSRIQANPDQWVAAVQLRQHVPHRRTFFYLEQLILKHGAAACATKIKQMNQGIDFFFANRSHGMKFVDFLGKIAPVRSWHDKGLVSHDPKSNDYNYKYTFSVEISPICREDLICLPPKVALSLGNLGPLVVCTKVTNNIALLDPLTLRHCVLDADQYWRSSFKSMLSSRQLVEYIVLDVEIFSSEVNVGGSKYRLADVQVARLADFGKNDTILFIRTHLGHLLKPGDHALGYDLNAINTNDSELDKYKSLVLPEAILVRKSYEEKRRRKCMKPRAWKLKSLDMEVDDFKARCDREKSNTEYEEFLRDLEENPDLRFNISLYHNEEYQPLTLAPMTEGEDVPSIPLDELLADLDLSDDEHRDSMRE